jgi:hypothetical protein
LTETTVMIVQSASGVGIPGSGLLHDVGLGSPQVPVIVAGESPTDEDLAPVR